ncbi:MAG: lysostaphin resistance A-like protein, partial [Pyrinomonadaceae bacterium]
MSPRDIFFNNAGRLRSGWRVFIFAVLFVAVFWIFSNGVRVVYALIFNFAPTLSPHPFIQNLIYRVIFTSAALGAGYVCIRWLEGLPWRALGISLHHHWFRHLLIGSLIGVASLALATGLAMAGGGLSLAISPRHLLFEVGKTLVFSAALFTVAALAEESLFRGYPLQTLTRAQLGWLGVLLTSIPFAMAHLNNPNVVPYASLNTGLAGVWLAVAYLRTRSLWFPLGVHWAWNWALGSLFGLPVSGINSLAPYPLMRGTDLGPAWLTGGSYGIEGGLACTIALVVSTIFIWRTRLVAPTEEILRLTSQENPAAARIGILP